MLDLVEGAKIIQALCPTTQGSADDGDYVNMENAHAVWTIINIRKPTNAITFTPKTASAYAGTGAAAVDGGCKFWINTGTTTLDRMTASTATTALACSATTDAQMIVCRYDPANAPTSHPYFSVIPSTFATSGTGTIAMTYILDSRYPGYQQIVSTTSST